MWRCSISKPLQTPGRLLAEPYVRYRLLRREYNLTGRVEKRHRKKDWWCKNNLDCIIPKVFWQERFNGTYR